MLFLRTTARKKSYTFASEDLIPGVPVFGRSKTLGRGDKTIRRTRTLANSQDVATLTLPDRPARRFGRLSCFHIVSYVVYCLSYLCSFRSSGSPGRARSMIVARQSQSGQRMHACIIAKLIG
jgi:hypothetical protein